jgi:hypothetical protein
MDKIKTQLLTINDTKTMYTILNSPYSLSIDDFKPGKKITCFNKMDKGKYSYILEAEYGDHIIEGYFEPHFTPDEMLELGVFEGKYLNDCLLEFPREWFLKALKAGTLSPSLADISCNYFQIKSRQALYQWEENEWIYGDDNRGWFQWYCRYYCGRRYPEIDDIQIKRWRKFKRHFGAVEKNCEPGDLSCRPKQRQGLLQWSYNCFI